MTSMHAARKSLVVVAVLSGLAGSAQVANAQPPAGTASTCPGTYETMTLEQLRQQADRNGIPRENADAAFHRVNKNEDSWICQTQLSGENHYNFIDNQAIGTDRP